MSKHILTVGLLSLSLILAGCFHTAPTGKQIQPSPPPATPASTPAPTPPPITAPTPPPPAQKAVETPPPAKSKVTKVSDQTSPPPVSPAPTPASKPVQTSPPAQSKVTVTMTANGFEPSQVEVSSGTTVRFVNKDTELHWPASGVHPTHQICPGFDSLAPVASGESYTFTFIEAKKCPMHDHLNPGIKGAVVVK